MKSMKWTQVFVFLLALGLVGMSVFPSAVGAQPRPLTLSDSEEAGSVIVFPKFIKGVTAGVPNSELEISVVCPKALVLAGGCPDPTTVRIRAHWVCPGNVRSICRETDFNLTTTVNGTIYFNPNNAAFPAPGGGSTVPPAPCQQGYLIAWVIDNLGRPIKFDGLIGDGVIRHGPNSAGAYNAIPIQAHPALGTGALIALDPGGALPFTGAPGQYQALTQTALSAVKYDRLDAVRGNITTFLTMLTLDVQSNRVNTPTFVDFIFWDRLEVPTSTSTDFICWAQIALSEIDPVLAEDFKGRKGSFVGVAVDPAFVPRTLLVNVETLEFNAAGGLVAEYSYAAFNDSTPVPTSFRP